MQEPDEEAVDRALAILEEHWECVHIVCSRWEDGVTRQIDSGSGNDFARVAHLQKAADKIASRLSEDDDDDEIGADP